MTTSIPNNDAKSRLIFALDIGDSYEEALSWVGRLKDHVGMFKVGKEAFTLYGPRIVEAIQAEGGRVFLDLKFHDIPNTVARASEGAVKLGVGMFNLHASGGLKMMTEAVSAVRKVSNQLDRPRPILLAVTILTSLNDEDLAMVGFRQGTEEMVVLLAALASKAGIDGVVCSPKDITAVRRACGDDFLIVTPGVRGAAPVSGDDQKRTLSPREAMALGADYLVVGRPIRMAADPVREADAIVEAIADGLSRRR
jgi:orotidine-5'-phosphate decarboxylase